jgi:hypothetical protein
MRERVGMGDGAGKGLQAGNMGRGAAPRKAPS